MIDYSVKPPPQDRWAALLDALSHGLGQLAQARLHKEDEEARETHLDSREAANRAFQENLSRFSQGEESKRATESQAGETLRERERTAAEGERSKSEDQLRRDLAEQEHQDRLKQIGVEGGRVAAENRRADAEVARAEAADKREAAREERDKHTKDRADALTALSSVGTEQKAALAQYQEFQKEAADIGKQGMAQAASARIRSEMKGQPDDAIQSRLESTPGTTEFIGHQLTDLKTQLDALSKDSRSLRSNAGYPSSQDAATADAGSSKLSPDRQMIYDAARQAHPDQDPNALMDKVRGLPQDQVDQAIQSRPSADTSTGQDPSQAMIADSGTAQRAADPTSMAFNDPGSETADANAPQTPDTTQQGGMAGGDELAQAEPQGQTSEEEISADDQFKGMEQQLNQTPEGQGVHTTLDRLAQASNSVQADKLHRQAQLQLADQFPDQDPDSYIDWYIQQQQQEPAYT